LTDTANGPLFNRTKATDANASVSENTLLVIARYASDGS